MDKVKIIILVVMSFLLVGCNTTKFNGNRTGNTSQFISDFTILNTKMINEFELVEGDIIDVNIFVEKGSLTIDFSDNNGENVYKSDKAVTSNFQLRIDKSGVYNLTVTGSKCEGKVSFVKIED